MHSKNVPKMTPDLFYGFENPDYKESLSRPSRPVRNKFYRSDYRVAGDSLHITNGPNLFNRPLYAPGCRTLVTAGDRPAFILWQAANYKKLESVNFNIPDCLGYMYCGISCNNKSKWLHELDECITQYHPGWVEYNLKDSLCTGFEMHIEVVPHASGSVLIYSRMHTGGNTTGAEQTMPELIWTHGCLSMVGRNSFRDCYDITHRHFDWNYPEFAANDSVEFINDLTVLRDNDDLTNWVSVGSFPLSSKLGTSDSRIRLDISPEDVFLHPGGKNPIAAGRIIPVPAKDGGYECCLILNWGRNNEPASIMQEMIRCWREHLAEAKMHFQKRHESIYIKTPDKELDTIFGFTTVAADAMWHPPAVSHTPYAWPGLTTIFRTYYGLTCCGDHDRISSALNFHCSVDGEGRLENLAGSHEEKPKSSGYQSYGSTVDMLWHHYLWSNDRDTLKKWAPVIDKMLDYEEKNRKADDGLFIDHLGFWCSDSFDYEYGCAVGTIFVWLMYSIRTKIACILGEDTEQYFNRAEEIKRLLYEKLWCEEKGFFLDTVYPDGSSVISPIAPVLYHAVEFGVADEANGGRLLDHLFERLTSPEGMVKVDDWYPLSWSHGVYSPLETGNAAVAAYKLRRKEDGYKMLRGIVRGTLYEAMVPGSICSHSSSTGCGTKTGADFGDGVSLFLRSVIEGLFGIHLNLPEETITIAPNFPDGWENAEMSIPDLDRYKFSKTVSQGKTKYEYEIRRKTPVKIKASIPAEGKVDKVYVNQAEVEFAVENRNGKMFACFFIEKCTDASISVLSDAVRSSDFEHIIISTGLKVPFSEVYRLFPNDMTWQLKYRGKNWRCVFDGYCMVKNGNLMISDDGIPFSIDRDSVAAIRKPQDAKIWKGSFESINVPEELEIPVDKPAGSLYFLFSGLCSPMTCYMPQVKITLSYEGGNDIEYRLSSPDEFDYICQHTSTHHALHIGWFGNQEGLSESEYTFHKDRIQQLHADVLHLKGMEGKLKKISIKALKSGSGIIIHGITIASL